MPVQHLKARHAALSLAVVLAGFRYSSAATTDTYLGSDNGLWSDPANWSAGIPNNANQTYNVDMTAGWLTVRLDTSVIVDTLAIGAADTLHVLPNAVLTLASGSLINRGTLFLDSGPTAQLLLKTDTQLSGGGYVILSGSNNRLDSTTTLRLISDNSIFGEGSIGNSGGTMKLVNLGSVTATTGRLILNASPSSAVSDSCINIGTFAADGGTLVLSGAIFNNTSGIIEARANSILTVNSGATLNGGILRSTGGGTVSLGSGSTPVTLSNTALSGNLQIAPTSAVSLLGSLSNAGTLSAQVGTLTFGSAFNSLQVSLNNTGLIQAGATGSIQVSADTILSGGGTLALDGNSYLGGGANAPYRLTSDNLITGRGTLGTTGSIGTVFTNNGTISATTGVLSLVCSTYFNSVIPVNNLNTGTLRADGGTLAIVGPINTNIQFSNAGGTIEALANSLVTIGGSNIFGGTLRSVGGGTVSLISSNILTAMAFQGLIQVQNGATIYFTGANSNAGTLLLSGVTSNFGIAFVSPTPAAVALNNTGLVQVGGTASGTTLVFNADTNFSGGGTVALNGNLYNAQSGSYPVRFTTDNFIFGRGTLGSVNGYGTYFTNNGTITATTATGILNLVTGALNSSNLQNSYNPGTLRADGGTLVISGLAPLYNTGGVIEAADNSVVALNAVPIVGGTLRSLGSGTVTGFGTFNGTLTGLTFAGLIQTQNAGTTYLLGKLTNTGTLLLTGFSSFGPSVSSSTAPPPVLLKNAGLLQVGPLGGPSATLAFTADTTFSGGGSITLNGSLFSFGGQSYSVRLTTDNIIIGRGSLGTTSGGGGTFFTNIGTIAASGGVLNLVTGLSSGQGTLTPSYNAGTLRAVIGAAGGTGGPTGGTLALSGLAPLINTGGIIEASAGSLVTIIGITVSGGIIRSLGGGTVTLNSNVALVDTALAGLVQTATATTFFIGALSNAGTLNLSGTDYFGPSAYQGVMPPAVTLVNTGLIQAGSISGPTPTLYISANTTLSGGGTLVLNNNLNNYIGGFSPRLTTDNTIIGRGVLGNSAPFGPNITNTGTISATTGLLTLNTNTAFSSTSPLNYNTGMLRAEGGTLSITGATGFINTGGVLEAAANSVISLSNTNISGGIVRSIAGGTVSLSGGTLTNVELGGILQVPNGAMGALTGSLKNTGSLSLLGGTSVTTQLNLGALSSFTLFNNTGQVQFGARLTVFFASDMLLAGGGSVTFSGNTTGLTAPARLTSDNFFSGAGTLGGGIFRLTNSGTISATSSTLTLQTDSSVANNNLNLGTLRADGGTLLLTGGSISNANGVIEALHSSKVFLRTLVSGGLLRVASGGVLVLDSASSIAADAAVSFEGGILQYTPANTIDYSSRFRTSENQAFSIDTNGQAVSFATGLHSVGGSLTKLGAGTLTLLGANDFTGSTMISAGTLQVGSGTTNGSLGASNITNAAALVINCTGNPGLNGNITLNGTLTGSGTVTKSGTGTAFLSAYQGSGPLTINAGRLVLSGSAQPPVRTSALTIAGAPTAPTTALDIKDGALIVSYVGTGATEYATLYKQITAGKGALDIHAQFDYAGNGITSSSARAANVTVGLNLFAVGVLNNADLDVFGINPQYNATTRPFMNQAVTSNNVLARYTYAGDINLDGKINIDDYNYIDTAFASPAAYPSGWIAGDFNNDGILNIDDYNVIDTAFAFQGAPLGAGFTPLVDTPLVSLAASANPAPVPEPASLFLLGLGGVGLLLRRKRN